MSLTVGSGPFSEQPAGRFNTEILTPTGAVLFWDPVPQRIRAVFAKRTVVDSTGAKLLHETKGDARYWTLRVGERAAPDAVWAYERPLEPAPFLAGHMALYWEAVDEWFAEDEQLFGHPRDPYSRIDVYRTTRRVRVHVAGEVVADSVRARALFETGLPTRWYLPPEDVRLELLEPSPTRTRCAYKGSASYWHVRAGGELHEDLAWSYPAPQHDAEPVRDLIAFLNERAEIEVG